MPSTPYVIGQWVRGEKFYGRRELLAEVLEGNRNWIWLLGTRRIGKTSLLKQLEWMTASAETPGWFPLFWDFQGADDSEELRSGFDEAIFDAEERLEAIGIAPGDVRGTDLFESLGRLRRKVRGTGRKLLLLCDEVEELIRLHGKDPALLRKLRRALQSQEDIRTVMASTIRLWALAEQKGDTSPFLHGFAPPLYIHRLDAADALALIRQVNLPSASQPRLSDVAAETIRSRCDSHPYLMQLVAKRFLELDDLEDALERVAMDDMVAHFFAVDFEMLSSAEKEILRLIAESSAANSNSIEKQLPLDSAALGTSLQRLENLGYLRRNAERRFELANYFFRRWFGQHSRSLPSSSPAPASQVSTATDQTIGLDEGGLLDGRYRLIDCIGRGASGIVFRAQDEVLRETIAIKILKLEYCAHPGALERLRQEIVLSRDIAHPNVLRMYHMGEANGQKYITMKWVRGSTLAEALLRHGPMPLPRVVAIGRKLASALEAAHARKVLHRDVKPQNILLDEVGEPYLSDFGLARLLGGPGVTRGGAFIGTPDYASPEQANLRPLDERSDIYSLGVVLFELATGSRPFRGDSLEQVLEMHRSAPPPDPRRLRPDIPAGLSAAILRCLQKSAESRFPDARALHEALEAVRDV